MGFQYIIRPTSRSHISKTASNTHVYSVPRKSLLHIGKYDMRYRSGATRNHQKLMYVCVCKCMFCANGPGHALVVAELPDLFADDCVLLLHRCTFLPRCVAILSATGLCRLLLVISLKEWRPELRSSSRIAMACYHSVRLVDLHHHQRVPQQSRYQMLLRAFVFK